MQKIISYISELKKNNTREWYHENKDLYNEAREIFLLKIQNIIDKLQLLDPRLSEVKAKDTVFRIYRDIRFSNDKTPYKTHFSAYIAKGGRKSPAAGYYVHISDDEFFLGSGVYSPEKEELKAIRQEILFQPELFTSLVRENEKRGYILMEEGKLKNGPKDFPKDSPYIEFLKYRHFIFSIDLSKEEVLYENFPDIVVQRFESIIPFNNFLNTAIEFKGNE